jgi:hypothetical protein
MTEVRRVTHSASSTILIITTGPSQGTFLALAQALGQIEDQELLVHERSPEAAALHQALLACPIDSLDGLRWATRDLRQLLELEDVTDDAVVLSRKIEAYASRINLPEHFAG